MGDEGRQNSKTESPAEPFTPDGRIDPSFQDKISIDTDAWFKIWDENLTLKPTSHRRLLGKLIVLLRKALRPFARFALADLYQRQRLFNLAVLYMLVPREEFEARIRALREELTKFSRDLVRQASAEIMDRDDAVFNILDRKADWIEESVRRLEELVVQRDAIINAKLERAKTPQVTAVSDKPHRRLNESLGYLRFEDIHRGTEADIASRQSVYVDRFKDTGTVLDIGCGRGEFLEKLTEAGIPARGVDHSEDMVQHCRNKGLEVKHGDSMAYLKGLDDGSLGGVFAAQLIEHFDLDQIMSLVSLAFEKLSAKGRIIIETQNPEALHVGGSSFYRDPTHVRPIHPDGLSFILRSCGFRDVEVIRLSYPQASEQLTGPRTPPDMSDSEKMIVEDMERVVKSLNKLLYGSQDYAVTAIR
ncbi:class I SAM-dependent methyltransferase [Acidobacteriota bacterium]